MTDEEDSVSVTVTSANTTVGMGQTESVQAEPVEEVMEEGTEEDEEEESGNENDNDGDASASSSAVPGGISSSKSKAYPSPLEWKFLDFRKAERCPIFDVDPVMLKKFIGHNVTVVNFSNEKFHGCCLTIDPVSLSVILARRTAEGKIRIITLPGYHLNRIYVNPNCVLPENTVSVNDLDIAELYHARSLFTESSSSSSNSNDPKEDKKPEELLQVSQYLTLSNATTPTSPNDADCSTPNPIPKSSTAEDIQKRKELLKTLLSKNLMPCTEKGDTLELPGGIKILPPYTTETCDTKGNQLIQKKLGELIATLKNVSKT